MPGAGVKIGYFSQDNAETIKGTQNILEYLESVAPLELIPKLRDMLGAFLFRGDDVYKSLDVLSGGEKSRIALLQLLLSPVNLLILDEPTNHLDIHSKDVLLEALKDFGGTVIFVSHDRGFIEKLATKVLSLSDGTYKYFPGGYDYYLEQLEKNYAGEGEVQNNSAASGSVAAANTSGNDTASASDTKLSWEEQKKREAEKRKIEKEVQKIEEQIDALETKKAELETKMANPEVYSNGEKAKAVQTELNEVTSKIDELTEEWTEAAEKLSEY